jgi:site-specific DNA recombinase
MNAAFHIFGYRVAIRIDVRGDPVRGERQVDDAAARVVRRIFEEFAPVKSPRAIAKLLNAQAVPGPGDRP